MLMDYQSLIAVHVSTYGHMLLALMNQVVHALPQPLLIQLLWVTTTIVSQDVMVCQIFTLHTILMIHCGMDLVVSLIAVVIVTNHGFTVN